LRTRGPLGITKASFKSEPSLEASFDESKMSDSRDPTKRDELSEKKIYEGKKGP
jgi:hypothetical protein